MTEKPDSVKLDPAPSGDLSRITSSGGAVKRNEVPPWHPWCGCYGCRAGEAIVRRYRDRGAGP